MAVVKVASAGDALVLLLTTGLLFFVGYNLWTRLGAFLESGSAFGEDGWAASLDWPSPYGLSLGLGAVLISQIVTVSYEYLRIVKLAILPSNDPIQTPTKRNGADAQDGPYHPDEAARSRWFSEQVAGHIGRVEGLVQLGLYLSLTWMLRLMPAGYYTVWDFDLSRVVAADVVGVVRDVALQVVVVDLCMYLMHRSEHLLPAVYKAVHLPHHRWVRPSLFDAFNGSLLDTTLLVLTPLYATACALPWVSCWGYLSFGCTYASWLMLIHCGGSHYVDALVRPLGITVAADHNVHHARPAYNYAHFVNYWDYLFGTYLSPEKAFAQAAAAASPTTPSDQASQQAAPGLRRRGVTSTDRAVGQPSEETKASSSDEEGEEDDEQRRLMDEDMCLVVDEDDRVVGRASKRDCHRSESGLILHRAFSVFMFDQEGRLLLQKRAPTKITFADYWANTCCSHPLANEPGEAEEDAALGVKRAAIRKLGQELGIPASQVPVDCFRLVGRVHYRASCDDPAWGEHEVDHILICTPPGPVTLEVNPNEVGEARWFSREELSAFMTAGRESQPEALSGRVQLLSPWFDAIEARFVAQWWDALVEGSLQEDVSPPIHRVGDAVQHLLRRRKAAPAAAAGRAGDAAKKQGAYGKVPTHAHSKLEQLSHPLEVISALRVMAAQRADKKAKQFRVGAPASASTADLDFCEDSLVAVSRSFAAVIRELPDELRLPVAIFYLVLRALDTIEDEMDLSRFPGGVEQKMELLGTFAAIMRDPKASWTMQGVGEGAERELLERLPCVIRVFQALPAGQQDVIADITKRMGDGMAQFAQRDLATGTKNDAEFRQYCHYVAGLVGEGLTRQFVAAGLERESVLLSPAGRDTAEDMGQFLQRTNIIRDYLEDLVDRRSFWPKTTWGHYAPTLPALRDDPNGAGLAALNELVTQTLELAPQCLQYLANLQSPAVFRFCAIPQLMAIATLAELYAEPRVFTGVVKIRKGLACRLLLGSGDMPSVQRWFRHFASQILRRVESAAMDRMVGRLSGGARKRAVEVRDRARSACLALGGEPSSWADNLAPVALIAGAVVVSIGVGAHFAPAWLPSPEWVEGMQESLLQRMPPALSGLLGQ